MDHAMQKAITRIQTGQSTVSDEAKRLGKHSRTIERRLAAAKLVAGQNAVSEVAVPSATAPVSGSPAAPPKVNEALNAALSAAGEAAKPAPGAVPTPTDIVAAQVDQYQFCVETVSMLKMTVGGALVQLKYTPPLSISDADVHKVLALSAATATAIRVNVAKLYPTLTKVMAGAGVIYGILAVEVIGMLVGLHGLAAKAGWKKAEEPEKKPDVQKYAEQLKPKPAPPPPAPAPAAPPQKGAETIVNAPVPEYGG